MISAAIINGSLAEILLPVNEQVAGGRKTEQSGEEKRAVGQRCVSVPKEPEGKFGRVNDAATTGVPAASRQESWKKNATQKCAT